MELYVRLPFCDSPVFTIYNDYSFVTGIIQGNNNNSFEPWAYGGYVNCMFNPGFGFRVFGYNHILDVNSKLICRVKSVTPPKTKWLEYWRSLLNDELFIQVNVDEQYIPGKWAYKRCKYYHDSLIIGYDDDKQVFSLFARLADQNMHVIEVSYSDIQKSYVEKGSWFLLYKYTPDRIDLDVPLIRKELSHYYYSSPSAEFTKGTRYGIKAVEYLCEYLIKQHKHKEGIDYRLTRGLLEHKSLMFSMCKYLNSIGYDLSEDILELCKKASDTAQKIHLLTLKSYVDLKSNHNLDERIKKQFDILLECERKYIPLLLKHLCI